MKKQAVIYARVSGSKQVIEGHGLDSQITRCKEYAIKNGFNIIEVFQDEAVSGKESDRKGMNKLLKFLTKNKDVTTIIDDQKRLARDLKVYILLKESLNKFGSNIIYLNQNFEDSPEGRFIETILASAGQLEREQNARQVKQKMKARIQNGYYCLSKPLGYNYIKTKHGKLLTPDPNITDRLKAVFEGFANGQFVSIEQARKELILAGVTVSKNYFPRLIKNILYTGYIELPRWEIKRMEGKHKGIISLEIYEKIQERIKNYDPERVTANTELFILKRHVVCGECGRFLTGYLANSHTGKKYPYYVCANRKCKFRQKTIKKDIIENSLKEILDSYAFSSREYSAVKQMLEFNMSKWIQSYDTKKEEIRETLRLIEEDIQDSLRKIKSCHSELVLKLLENSIEEESKRKLLAEERLKNLESQKVDETQANIIIENLLNFVSKGSNIWKSGDTNQKKRYIELINKKPMEWSQDGLYLKPHFTELHEAFIAIKNNENDIGVPGGARTPDLLGRNQTL